MSYKVWELKIPNRIRNIYGVCYLFEDSNGFKYRVFWNFLTKKYHISVKHPRSNLFKIDGNDIKYDTAEEARDAIIN